MAHLWVETHKRLAQVSETKYLDGHTRKPVCKLQWNQFLKPLLNSLNIELNRSSSHLEVHIGFYQNRSRRCALSPQDFTEILLLHERLRLELTGLSPGHWHSQTSTGTARRALVTTANTKCPGGHERAGVLRGFPLYYRWVFPTKSKGMELLMTFLSGLITS